MGDAGVSLGSGTAAILHISYICLVFVVFYDSRQQQKNCDLVKYYLALVNFVNFWIMKHCIWNLNSQGSCKVKSQGTKHKYEVCE